MNIKLFPQTTQEERIEEYEKAMNYHLQQFRQTNNPWHFSKAINLSIDLDIELLWNRTRYGDKQ